MYKRRMFQILIFSALCLFAFAMAGFFFPAQNNVRREYYALKNGQITAAQNHLQFRVFNPSFSVGQSHWWQFSFVINANGQTIRVFMMTAYLYTEQQVENMRIHFIVDGDGVPVFNYQDGERVSQSIRRIEGGEPVYRTHYQITAREDLFFVVNPNAPGFAGPIFLLFIGLVLLGVVAYNMGFVLLYRSIEKRGIFAYAVIADASSSRFGSKRWMSITYRYQLDDGEWVEAASPYTFRPLEVEYFKSLDAISVKYRGSKSIITEKRITRASAPPPF